METSPTLSGLLAERWPAVTAAVFACFVAFLVPKALGTLRMSRIPTVGEEFGGEEKRRQAYLAGARKLYNEGYKKVCSI
jgi:hypothetical protein